MNRFIYREGQMMHRPQNDFVNKKYQIRIAGRLARRRSLRGDLKEESVNRIGDN